MKRIKTANVRTNAKIVTISNAHSHRSPKKYAQTIDVMFKYRVVDCLCCYYILVAVLHFVRFFALTSSQFHYESIASLA